MHYVFGSCALYPDRAQLSGPDSEVRLEPKAYAVLRHLVEHHDRVVSREELIEAVWGGRFISDSAVSTALKFAHKAVADDGIAQTKIRTLHGAGHGRQHLAGAGHHRWTRVLPRPYAARAFARFQGGLEWFASDRAKAQEDVRRLAERAYELDLYSPEVK